MTSPSIDCRSPLLPSPPAYGLTPHLDGTGPGLPVGTHFVPRELWPGNLLEDPARPFHGWWCDAGSLDPDRFH